VNRLAATLLSILAVGFVPGGAHAFRTAADTPGFVPGNPVRWPGAIHWRVSPGGVDGIAEGEVGRTFEGAFATWSSVSCASIAAVRDPDGFSTASSDGVVTVVALGAEWAARGYPRDVPARTEVVYRETSDGFVIADADIFLNDAGFDIVASGDGTLLEALALHEVGHVLGLLHCCGRLEGAPACGGDPVCTDATMHPTYDPVTQSRLGADDQLGVCWLYPRDTCADITCEPGLSCRAGACLAPPLVCSADRDCPSAARCVRGECALGQGPVGEPCGEDLACSTGLCGGLGYCTNPCDMGGACPTGFECSDLECVAYLGVPGDTCSSSLDCIDGQCLSGASRAPLCTRLCGTREDCPSGWECVAVEEREVCRPPASSSCTAGRAGSAQRWPWFLFSTVAVVAFLRRAPRCFR